MQIQKGRCRPCEAAKLAAAQRATGQLAPDADVIKSPDFGLLGPLKRSPEYAEMRKRVAEPMPIDAWEMDMVHYFIFQLKPLEDAPAGAEPPYVLFEMRYEDYGPLSVLLITPKPNGEEAEVVNLRAPGDVQVMALPRAAGSEVTATAQ